MKTTTPIFINSLPQSPLTTVWVALSEQGLWALEFQVDKVDFIQTVQTRGPGKIYEENTKTQTVLKQVSQYLAGKRKTFDLQIDWSGMTGFQVLVRKAVMAIPYGKTSTYGEIAAQIGRPKAARAVGLANATNPIPLVIPCHRVVGAKGALTGYGGAGGIKTKQWLLDLEKGI